MVKTYSPEEILDLPMGKNDADAATIRDYLKALLNRLWAEEEGFSSKRPFGNSGWSIELYTALAISEAIEAEWDPEEEYLEHYDSRTGDTLIFEAIEAL